MLLDCARLRHADLPGSRNKRSLSDNHKSLIGSHLTIQKPFRMALVAELSQHISQYSAGPFVVVPEGWDKPVSTQLIRFKGDIASGRDYALGILDAI